MAPRRLAELLQPRGGSEGGAARLPLQPPRRRGGGGGGRHCSRPCDRPAEQRAPGMCRVCAWRVRGVCMVGSKGPRRGHGGPMAGLWRGHGGGTWERPRAAAARRSARRVRAIPPPSTWQGASAPRESPATAPGGGGG
eukprot:scaffold69046_cov77-Phaeocystis_antarctica.AAC.13